jgi:hypothetical protein
VPRVRRVHEVAAARERGPRRLERSWRPAQVARDERDLRLGHHAPRAGHGVAWAERARRAPEERPRALEVAELRYCDPPQRERGRVVAQRDPVQRAERIALGERAGRGRDHRVHR